MEYLEEEIDYNEQIDLADNEIAAGDFVKHEDVKKLFQKRREIFNLNFNPIKEKSPVSRGLFFL
jgi:hypothetical protein